MPGPTPITALQRATLSNAPFLEEDMRDFLLTAKDTLQEECGLTLQPGSCLVFDSTPRREPEPENRRGGALERRLLEGTEKGSGGGGRT